MSSESNELALKLRDKVMELEKQLASERELADELAESLSHCIKCVECAEGCNGCVENKGDCVSEKVLSKWKQARAK